MKLIYIDKETRQDRINSKKSYEYGKSYPIEDEARAKELLNSGFFRLEKQVEIVKPATEQIEEAPVEIEKPKRVKKSTK